MADGRTKLWRAFTREIPPEQSAPCLACGESAYARRHFRHSCCPRCDIADRVVCIAPGGEPPAPVGAGTEYVVVAHAHKGEFASAEWRRRVFRELAAQNFAGVVVVESAIAGGLRGDYPSLRLEACPWPRPRRGRTCGGPHCAPRRFCWYSPDSTVMSCAVCAAVHGPKSGPP